MIKNCPESGVINYDQSCLKCVFQSEDANMPLTDNYQKVEKQKNY